MEAWIYFTANSHHPSYGHCVLLAIMRTNLHYLALTWSVWVLDNR